MARKLTRRDFLRASVMATVGIAAASCAQPTAEVVQETVVVGVNKYTDTSIVSQGKFRIDPSIAERQRVRLEEFKKGRDTGLVAKHLDSIEKAARGAANLMPPIVAAVKADCTLGEISSAMEKVFGRYSPAARVK